MIDHMQTTRLPNGLTILTEHMPGLRSVSFGIWVRHGSRHEMPALNGICHFIEHSLFKGTQRRTAHQIAEVSDRLGGHLDAYTTHEMIGFSMKVVDTEMARGFELLADMLLNPKFDEDDLAREQKVIIEEMKMIEDTPDELLADLVLNPKFDEDDLAREQKVIIEEMKMIEDTPDELLNELFHAAYFPDHSLGRPIEGTEETVSSFDHATTASFHRQNFAPHNLGIAAAGNVTHNQLEDLVAQNFNISPTDSSDTVTSNSPNVAAPILIERKNA